MESSDRLLATTLRLVLVGAFLWMIHDLLVPIALGALGAMLLFPLKLRLDRRLQKRAAWSPSLLTAGVVVVVVIPVGLVAAKVVVSVNDFLDRDWPATFDTLRSFVWTKFEAYGGRMPFDGGLKPETFGGTLQDLVSTVGTALADAAQGIAVALPGQLLALFIFLLSLYYFLRDGSAVTKAILMLSPFTREATEELFESVQETVNGAIVGVSVTALVQGVLTMLALAIFGVPGAFIFGVLATALAVIPLVGTTPITFGAVIYLIAVDRSGAAVGMLVAAVIIGVSDNVVRPWVQSRGSKMHPLLVLLSLFGGLEVFGTAGVFIGPVVGAMAVWTFDRYATLRRKHLEREGPLSSSRPPSGLG